MTVLAELPILPSTPRVTKPLIWTQPRIKLLAELVAEGYSATQIACEMGCFGHCRDGGRSAVLGRIFRDGLGVTRKVKQRGDTKRGAARKPRRVPAGIPAPREPACEPMPPLIDDSDIPVAQRKTIMQLTDTTCRWPCGDVGSSSFFFCGAPPLNGLPYCPAHSQRSYRSVAEARQESAAFHAQKRHA